MTEEKKAEHDIEWHENKCCCQDLQIAIKANRAWLKKDTALEEEIERLKADLEEANKNIRRLEKTIKFAERYGFSTKQMKELMK